MHNGGSPPAPKKDTGLAACPIDHSGVNPLNQMPHLPQTPLSPHQLQLLQTERETSTIPRTLSSTDDTTIPSSSTKWVYPSAQQFYNALVRKGWETPEEDVDSMVFIHNHLNEVAWREVLAWEAKRGPGMEEECELARFKGKPGQLSPKARFHLALGYLFPNTYK